VSLSATPRKEHNAAPPAVSNGADQPIAKLGAALTAFVGRALRGPINLPVAVNSFAEFQQIFGGLWQPSSLSYAVEQFFEQGGRHAVVVRIVNGGAPPTISLRCGSKLLKLRALAPGTREFLRAAVDYDNLPDDEQSEDAFNLVVQRVRSHGSERIEIQETFRRVSVDPATNRFVATVLAESQLVRVEGDVPAVRPDITYVHGSRHAGGYADSNNDGDDGGTLTEYDIIGSAVAGTGLFALAGVENIGFIYIPPLSRTLDIGATTLLVAEKFCRERRALLIVDPPVAWTSVERAIAGMQALHFRSEHALLYFPRIVAGDRLRARTEVFPNGGAVAGMLARAEEQRPVYAMNAPEPDQVLRSGIRLSVALNERDRWRLAMHGINMLRAGRSASEIKLVPRTMAGSLNSAADWAYLPQQRLASYLVNSIEIGTRWTVWSQCDATVRARVVRQVTEFLQDAATLGSFPAAPAEQAFLVVCDERIHTPGDIAARRLKILLALAGSRPADYRGFLIDHSPTGSTIKSVAINRLELPIVIEPKIFFDNDFDTTGFVPQAL